MFFLVYYVFGYRKQVVTDNLAHAFPELTDSDRKKIRHGFYRNFTDVIVETIKAITISKEEILRRVKVVNPEFVADFQKNYSGVILMGSHNTNWEYMPLSASAVFTIPLLGAYKKLKNKKVGTLMNGMRTRFGLIPVAMEESIATVRNLDEFSAFGLIADQSPQQRKKNLFLEFFGRTVPFYRGPVFMAKIFDLPVLYASMKRIKRGFYELNFEEIASPPYQHPEEEIMKKFIRLLEAEIREQPDGYLWSHKRWKHASIPIEKKEETV